MPKSHEMTIKLIPLGDINPAPYNPRIDLQPDDPEYKKIKKSIEKFGLAEPLVWNQKTKNLVGGHQRLKVLADLEYVAVMCSVVKLSLADEKALNLALNKIEGGWDIPKLKDILEELDTGELDMEVTGFDDTEIEALMTATFHDFNDGVLHPDQEAIEKVKRDMEAEFQRRAADWQNQIVELVCPDCGYTYSVQAGDIMKETIRESTT